MDSKQFMEEVKESYERSVKVLLEKEKEYSVKGDRLGQFHEVAKLAGSNPAEALVAMSAKHFTSIVRMAQNPYTFSPAKWNEKITDLRNYTFLLDALLRDMEVLTGKGKEYSEFRDMEV